MQSSYVPVLVQADGESPRGQYDQLRLPVQVPAVTPGDKRPSPGYIFWLWEISASITSIVSVAAIFGILAYVQGMPLDHWQHTVGLNISPTAVVSIIGTISKSTCMVALTAIISQLKWMHFGARPQAISDLELFDNASRGPWGALQLVLRKSTTALLAVSASVITIAALLMDPFIQLVFSFPNRLTPIPGATLPILSSQVYDSHNLTSRWTSCYGPADIDSVLQAAILAPVWNTTPSPSLPCNFERCEWPTVTTLGVCSSCSDLTSSVTSECEKAGAGQIQCNYTISATNVTFATLFSLTGGAAEMIPYQPLWNSTSAADATYDTYYESLKTGRSPELVSFSFISFAPNLPWQQYITSSGLTAFPAAKQAMQCTFNLCARTFNTPYYANFSAGLLEGPQTPLAVSSLPSIAFAPMLVELTPPHDDHPAMNTSFQINFCDYEDLARYMAELFTVQYYSGDMTPSSRLIAPNIGLELSASENITAFMQAIADSTTEFLRTAGNSTSTAGIGLNTVTYISVSWAWLALPTGLILLTFFMLLIVIFRSQASGIPTWKSSNLALLFHDLDGWDRSEVHVAGPADMAVHAKVMAALVSSENGDLLFKKEK